MTAQVPHLYIMHYTCKGRTTHGPDATSVDTMPSLGMTPHALSQDAPCDPFGRVLLVKDDSSTTLVHDDSVVFTSSHLNYFHDEPYHV